MILSIYCCSPADTSNQELLTPTAFAEELKSNTDIVLIDVRTPEEVQTGIIEGAKAMDYNAEGFEGKLDSLDHSKTYFVYCAAGKRSGKALELMKQKGFIHVTSLDGGLKSWNANGLPLTKP